MRTDFLGCHSLPRRTWSASETNNNISLAILSLLTKREPEGKLPNGWRQWWGVYNDWQSKRGVKDSTGPLSLGQCTPITRALCPIWLCGGSSDVPLKGNTLAQIKKTSAVSSGLWARKADRKDNQEQQGSHWSQIPDCNVKNAATKFDVIKAEEASHGQPKRNSELNANSIMADFMAD